ncbi:MAG: mannosyl-3-phosphoglycerate phosphatase [bacterium]
MSTFHRVKNKPAPDPFPVIITDLDGTLLDHHTYSFEEARPALELIRQRGIPLIMCSSKTRAEIEKIRKKLNNADPFISENGGGVFVPGNYFSFPFSFDREKHGYSVIELGTRYEKLIEALKRIQETTGLPLKGFSTMNTGEVAGLCGLSVEDAFLARQREYDEPFLVDGGTGSGFQEAENTISEAVRKEGLFLTRGGRFYHLTGPSDKGRAVRILLELFQRQKGNIFSIALGDSRNDAPMLKEADVAVLIQKEDGSCEEIEGLSGFQSDAPGPRGWNRAILRILKD